MESVKLVASVVMSVSGDSVVISLGTSVVMSVTFGTCVVSESVGMVDVFASAVVGASVILDDSVKFGSVVTSLFSVEMSAFCSVVKVSVFASVFVSVVILSVMISVSGWVEVS